MVCRCICQICICGKHQCPIHGNTTVCIGSSCKATESSEYTNRYKAHAICKVQPCKPDQCVPDSGEFCGETTFRTDYKVHENCKRDAFKYCDTLKQHGKLESTTNYNKEYQAKEICRAQSCKPDYDYCKSGEFCEDTTSRTDYKAWCQKPRQPCKLEDKYVPPDVAMSGDTTTKATYKAHDICKPMSCKPCDMPIESGNFCDITENKATYVAHAVCKLDSCKPLEEVKSAGPFDALTINKMDYTVKCIPKTPSCKPENPCLQSDVPLCDNTEFKDNFKVWCGQKPQPIIPCDNLVSKGQMDTTTSHKRDFTYQGSCRVASCKPAECIAQTDVPFEGNSTFRSDYKVWCQDRRASCAPDACYQPPTEAFDDNTAYKSNYVVHDICKTKSCKPELCVAEKCDFYGDTEYKTSYNYKQAAACPVLSLAELGYEFVQQTKDGHQVFSKFCDPACPHNFQKPNLGTAPPKK